MLFLIDQFLTVKSDSILFDFFFFLDKIIWHVNGLLKKINNGNQNYLFKPTQN